MSHAGGGLHIQLHGSYCYNYDDAKVFFSDIFFSDSAYRKYLSTTYSFNYEYGGLDYYDIQVANPETNAITSVTRKDAIVPTNYPIATRQHNKAVSKSYLE